MALKSKKETGLPEEFEETSIEKQVSLDLGLEVEAVDIDEEAEKEKEVYYTISGKEQQYNPQWEAYSINDFDIGEELEGVPEVTLFENEDKSYDAVRLRLIDEDEIVNLYFNFPKKAYPIVRNLKNIRTGEKDKFDFEWIITYTASLNQMVRHLRVKLKPEVIGGGKKQYIGYDRLRKPQWGIDHPEDVGRIMFYLRFKNGKPLLRSGHALDHRCRLTRCFRSKLVLVPNQCTDPPI